MQFKYFIRGFMGCGKSAYRAHHFNPFFLKRSQPLHIFLQKRHLIFLTFDLQDINNVTNTISSIMFASCVYELCELHFCYLFKTKPKTIKTTESASVILTCILHQGSNLKSPIVMRYGHHSLCWSVPIFSYCYFGLCVTEMRRVCKNTFLQRFLRAC